MTSDSDDVVLMEYGAVERANGWFVQERRPGARQHVEYGPMPESRVRSFIDDLKQSATAIATEAMEKQDQNLAALMRSDSGQPFNPAKEMAWLQKRRQ